MNIDNGWTNNIAIDQTIMFQTRKGAAKGIPKYILFVYTEVRDLTHLREIHLKLKLMSNYRLVIWIRNVCHPHIFCISIERRNRIFYLKAATFDAILLQ